MFGEPLFLGGIGAGPTGPTGPTGLAGFLVGCLFYSLMSLIFTVAYYAVKTN